MNLNIRNVLTSAGYAGYIETILEELNVGNQLETFFPTKPMVGLSYQYLKSANGLVELTSPSAFDAEPINQNRESFDAMSGELPLFRKKMSLTEKEKHELALYLKSGENEIATKLVRQIFDDKATLVKGALATMEFLRARALMDGKIQLASKGGAVSVDYGVPAANRVVLASGHKWDDPAAPIITDLNVKLDAIEDATGVRPDRMVLNRKTFRLLRNNTQIRDNLVPLGIMASASVKSNAIISDSVIKSVFEELTGIKEVIIYDKKVTIDKKVLSLVEDNRVAIVPAGKLGDMMIGTSPAELNQSDVNSAGGQVEVISNGIATNFIAKNDAPYTSEVQVEFIGLPSVPRSDEMLLLTVA